MHLVQIYILTVTHWLTQVLFNGRPRTHTQWILMYWTKACLRNKANFSVCGADQFASKPYFCLLPWGNTVLPKSHHSTEKNWCMFQENLPQIELWKIWKSKMPSISHRTKFNTEQWNHSLESQNWSSKH